MKPLFALLVILAAFGVLAENDITEEQYYVADIELHTADELLQILHRAEQLSLAGTARPMGEPRVTIVLHGPVLRSLLRENYRQNKKLVDQAASLSALEVIDVKACSSWMASNSVSPQSLQPFIETVAYGPAEVEKLLENQHYLSF